MAGHSHGGPGGLDMANLQAMMEAQMKPKELVSFRAGQLNMSHNRTVVADKRRGKLTLVQSPEDGLLRLQWVQRPNGQLQETDDMLVMPRAAFLEKVPECKTGRVILLRFRDSSRKRFFWMQEPKDDKDNELIKKVNDLIDNPPQLEGGAQGAGGPGGAGGLAGMEGLAGAGGGMGLEGMDVDQAALMEMLQSQPAARAALARAAGAAGGAAAAGGARPATSSSSSSGSSSGAKTGAAASGTDSKGKSSAAKPGGNQMSDAQIAALMNAAAREQVEANHGRHSLNEILDAERVLAAGLTDEEIQPLLQYLPEGQRTVGEFRNALRSPQFHQTLGRLSSVLNSSNFGPLVASFGLSPTGNIGVSGFTEAIEAATKRQAEARAKASGAASPTSTTSSAASPASGSAAAAPTPKKDDKKTDDKKTK